MKTDRQRTFRNINTSWFISLLFLTKKKFEAKMRTKTRTKDPRKLQKYRKHKKRKARRQKQREFLNRCNFAYAGQSSHERSRVTNYQADQPNLEGNWQICRGTNETSHKLTADNKFKKLHHISYVAHLRTFTKHRSGY